MNALLISDKSLMWRLASVYGPIEKWDRNTDVCSLTRAALKGLLICLLITCGGALVAGAIGDVLLWAYVCVFVGSVEPTVPAQVVMMLTLLALIITAGVYIKKGVVAAVDAYRRRREQNYAPAREPSHVVVAYRAFKNKYCVPVTVTSEKD